MTSHDRDGNSPLQIVAESKGRLLPLKSTRYRATWLVIEAQHRRDGNRSLLAARVDKSHRRLVAVSEFKRLVRLNLLDASGFMSEILKDH